MFDLGHLALIAGMQVTQERSGAIKSAIAEIKRLRSEVEGLKARLAVFEDSKPEGWAIRRAAELLNNDLDRYQDGCPEQSQAYDWLIRIAALEEVK